MVDIIAHRGNSAKAPENTLSAFKSALRQEVDYIEFDVRLSAEGIPIVIHDATLKRTTNCLKHRSVSKMTIDEIQSYDAGSWFSPKFKGEKIPTLKEVLGLDFGKCGLMIELKKGPYTPEHIVKATLDLLRQKAPKSLNYKIGSFDCAILNELIENNFSEVMGIIENKRMLNKFSEMPLYHLAICHQLITPSILQFLHARHVTVWSFTIDKPKLINSQLDGIITNNPKLLKSHLTPI